MSERPIHSLCNDDCPLINVAKSELRDLFLRQVAANPEAAQGMTVIERGLLSQIERLKDGCDNKGPGDSRIETVGGYAISRVCRSSAPYGGPYLEAVEVTHYKK